jgi:ABC-type transport system involved in multi-copper enzyme maturation permease subunit
VNAINIPVRHISREIENGTLELLLSHPFKRESMIVTLWFCGMFLLGLIVLAGFAGTIYAINTYHGLSWEIFYRVAQINVNMLLFSGFIMTMTLMMCSLGKAGGISGNISAAIVFVFYLIFIISQLWDKLKFTLPYNIFTYYEPSKLMLKQGNFVVDNLVFSALILVFLAGSVWVFGRRDVP